MSLSQVVAEKNQFEKLYFLNSACSSTARQSERDRAPVAFLWRRSPLSGGASPLSARNIFFSLDDDCGKSINYFVCKFWEKLLYGLKILHAQAGSTILSRTSGITANTFSSIAPSLMIES